MYEHDDESLKMRIVVKSVISENAEFDVVDGIIVEKRSSFKFVLPENDVLSMISDVVPKYGLNVNVSNNGQFANDSDGIDEIPLSIAFVNDLQFWKAELPRVFKLFGNVIVSSEEQQEKAELSIVCKLFGNSIDLSEEQL